MEISKVNQFIEKNRALLFDNKEFSENDIAGALMNASEDFESVMNKIPFRNPNKALFFAIFAGGFGVDRFYIGDNNIKSILKLLTLGGNGIWWIIDMFTAKKRCCSLNCKLLLIAINNPSSVSNMMSARSCLKILASAGVSIYKTLTDFRDSTFNLK